VLETVAAVPGMVDGAILPSPSLPSSISIVVFRQTWLTHHRQQYQSTAT
jgi:hypothetical protein